MKLKDFSELIWRLYQNGRPLANNQKLTRVDIAQKVKTLLAAAFRQYWYESKQLDEYRQPDYSFYSPVLSVKRFVLPDADIIGKRRADMGEFDLYRLPKNNHFTNIYPYAEGCGNQQVGEITQVAPGEENFYINNPDLSEEMFFVVKGRGIDTYNVPPCIKALDIETTYDGDDIDVDMQIGGKIADQILEVSLGIKKQYYSEDVRKQMAEQNLVK